MMTKALIKNYQNKVWLLLDSMKQRFVTTLVNWLTTRFENRVTTKLTKSNFILIKNINYNLNEIDILKIELKAKI